MRCSRLILAVFLVFSPLAVESAEYGFKVREAKFALQNDTLALSARIDYRFSATLRDALRHGLPLTLTVTSRIRQPRRGVWDAIWWQTHLDFRIQYYPLSRVFRVVDESNRFQRSFPRLDAALAALGELREIALPFKEGWIPPPHAYGEVMVRLNIERLPWALRPIAYFSPQWRLHSPVYRWPLSS